MNLFPVLYAILTLAGGIMGYIKVGSMASLIAGGISGALLLLCSILFLQQKPFGKTGLMFLFVALAGWFGVKFAQSGTLMPAGLMVLLSLVNLGVLLNSNQLAQRALR